MPTRLGNWVTASHRVCNSVLRDRRFGVQPSTRTSSDDFTCRSWSMNPPDHTRLRRLAQPAFSPKAVAAYRGRIEQTVAGLLDAGRAAGEFDLVPRSPRRCRSRSSPTCSACRTRTRRTSPGTARSIGSALDGIQSLRHAAELHGRPATSCTSCSTDLFELRRREPADDIVSRLVAAEGDQIQPGEMLPMCVLLLVAGFETTVNLIGNAVLALLDHPEQWAALCADPAGPGAEGGRGDAAVRPAGAAHRPGRAGTDRARRHARWPRASWW